MKRRNRIFLGILLIYAAGIAFLLYRLMADIDPRYRESAEESMVETAQLMASLVELDSSHGAIDARRLEPLFASVYARQFNAQIFDFQKSKVELRVYVTNERGRVIFDSSGKDLGSDFSKWNDVMTALAGKSGARTTFEDPKNPSSSVMYVSAPIRHPQMNINGAGGVLGALTVGKPTQSFGQFVTAARKKTLEVGAVGAVAVLLLALLVGVWLVRPFGVVADYVRFVKSQRTFSLPRLGARAWGALGAAYDEMRDALGGRNYVADYVQTLTHEIKSPLSAIKGATELLQEGVPEADRQRFLNNIGRETQRIQTMVDRMMELTALEARRSLSNPVSVNLTELARECADAARDAAARRNIQISLITPPEDCTVEGEAFLLQRAMANLLDNAIDFSPEGQNVELRLVPSVRSISIEVLDRGPGVPDYAQDKVFEKFYSLARPHNQKKSTGLGLSFVKEIAALHMGRAEIASRTDGAGALAKVMLPKVQR
jgi:two-component system, OmpR family, sensor histidine kinase CreC